MEVTVRAANVDDAQAIATINLRSWEMAYRGIVPDEFLDAMALPDREGRWRIRLAEASAPVLAAVVEERVVGYCALSLPARDEDADPHTAEIAAIYVAPEHVRTGVGSALMNAALTLIGDDDGWRAVTLWMLSENHPAGAFYRRFGFVPERETEQLDPRTGQHEIRLRKHLG